MAEGSQYGPHFWHDYSRFYNVCSVNLYICYSLHQRLTSDSSTRLMIQTVFWQQMVLDMNVDTNDLANAQSAQLAGLAVGCLFFIPLTVKYGRRLTYIVSIAVLAASSWWTAYMHTKTELMLSSLLSGLAGAINETAVQMTVGWLRQSAMYFPLTLRLIDC